jgi:hypothetical protein
MGVYLAHEPPFFIWFSKGGRYLRDKQFYMPPHLGSWDYDLVIVRFSTAHLLYGVALDLVRELLFCAIFVVVGMIMKPRRWGFLNHALLPVGDFGYHLTRSNTGQPSLGI